MNAYRIALILCRAVVLTLWVSAALNLVAALLMALAVNRGWFGLPTMPTGFYGLWWRVGSSACQIVLAIALQIFAPMLSAAMTGGAMLEGEAISSQRGLAKEELALARAGAGLMLLIFTLVNALPAVAGYGYAFLTGGLGTGMGRSVMIYGVTNQLVGAALNGGAGLLLAFHLGLRRLVKPR